MGDVCVHGLFPALSIVDEISWFDSRLKNRVVRCWREFISCIASSLALLLYCLSPPPLSRFVFRFPMLAPFIYVPDRSGSAAFIVYIPAGLFLLDPLIPSVLVIHEVYFARLPRCDVF